MNNYFIKAACLFAAFSVALGAFAAHGLRDLVEYDRLEIFQTGVRYQFYHSIALFLVGIFSTLFGQSKWLRFAGNSFIFGILLFSGSLYLLALKELFYFRIAWVGPLTPIGGVFFLLGWLLMFKASFSSK